MSKHLNTSNSRELESMIKPGQKLKQGDWFKPESIDQLKEIQVVCNVGANWYRDDFLQENLDNGFHPYYSERFKMVLFHSGKLPFLKTKYTFPDFRQLCINTFK